MFLREQMSSEDLLSSVLNRGQRSGINAINSFTLHDNIDILIILYTKDLS